jgi:hypothetical protein
MQRMGAVTPPPVAAGPPIPPPPTVEPGIEAVPQSQTRSALRRSSGQPIAVPKGPGGQPRERRLLSSGNFNHLSH